MKQGGEEDEARQKPNNWIGIRYRRWALLYRTTHTVHTIVCDRIGGFNYAVYACDLITASEDRTNLHRK